MTNKLLKEYIKFIIKEQSAFLNKNDYEVYLDMDGVLADFDGAIEQNNRANELEDNFENLVKGMPELSGLSRDEIGNMLKGQQTDVGMIALKKAWQELKNIKYSIAGKEGFFLNLNPYPWAGQLISSITEITGKKPSILTAPLQNDYCKEEKEQWMKNNFNGMYNRFHCTKNKEQYANPASILIDDREKYIGPFQKNGGHGILFTGDVNQAIEELKEIIFGQTQ